MTKFLIPMLAGLATAALPCVASAEEFPTKELTIIVNYAEGGAVDRTARSIQRFLPDALGQSVVVQNHGGAGGKIGLEKYMAAPRDGYTVLTSFAPATTIVADAAPDVFQTKELAIINMQWSDPAIIVAHKDTGWTGLDEMIEAVRANPGRYSFGSSGVTSVGHLLSAILFDKLNLDVKIVPYKGGGKTRAAFKGGHVDMTAAGAGGALAIKEDAVVLGVFWPSEVEGWPDAKPLNMLLEPHGVSVPEGGAYRFHAVHADVKTNYPERFNTLVNAFEEVTTNNEGFKAFTTETKVGADWLGPDKSTELLQEVDATFRKIITGGS